MCAQSLIGSIGPVVVFVGGFIGIKLAPDEKFATLPIAFMIVGTALFMLPVVKILASVGRKRGFQLAILWGIANTLFSAYAIYIQSFWLFCLSVLLYGGLIASAQQFRFAAMESVDEQYGGLAVSVLLIAGLFAAFLGPEIAFVGKDWFSTEYVGSFIGLTVLFSLSLIFIQFFNAPAAVKTVGRYQGRALTEIIKQPIFVVAILSGTVGFSVMSFIMTATPISMHVHHHFDLAETKWVIQSHIIAMYLPSFFTGILIRKFGHKNVLFAGLLAFLVCLTIGFIGQQYVHYWLALVQLGIGWNFLFVTATALLPMSYKPEEKFKIQGFNDLIMFSCQAIASLSAGWIIQQFGWTTMLSLCLPLLLITLFVIIWWQRSLKIQEG
ncbi:MFS transporter [Psychrosphaera sp. B3R10]|uniref:MFS transporter n=1 Tax=unclassified Psychrosphaera TaxID=2641570 RepID=UPI001C0A0D44|nr:MULTISPECIES: MFS transporter [unclassified Psychrosphaera]MBU2882626.1 MFS transporter [Psychrosphaera sp. I2R16]MBU2989355.1 MFS transporter [Psychrosphaera sp. B3R10]